MSTTNTTNKLVVNTLADGIEVINALEQRIAYLSTARQADGIFTDTWYGIPLDSELIHVMDTYYCPLVEQSRATKKLCDLRGFERGFDPINDWYVAEFLPKLRAAGIRYNAVVLPNDIFVQISGELFEEEAKAQGEVIVNRLFGDVDKALEWLQSQEA